MHFVYKMDSLFRSIRVSHGNSSVTKGFHFLELIWTPSFSIFKMHHWKPHHRLSTLSYFICYFSCIYWFFELNDPEIEKHYKWTLKRLKVRMVSSFHPHSMWKKVGRVTTKIRCTSCTKCTISFEVSGFHTETHLLQRDFNFLKLFELQTFCVFKMHHSKPHHQFSTLSDFICYFSCIYLLFWAIRP